MHPLMPFHIIKSDSNICKMVTRNKAGLEQLSDVLSTRITVTRAAKLIALKNTNKNVGRKLSVGGLLICLQF